MVIPKPYRRLHATSSTLIARSDSVVGSGTKADALPVDCDALQLAPRMPRPATSVVLLDGIKCERMKAGPLLVHRRAAA